MDRHVLWSYERARTFRHMCRFTFNYVCPYLFGVNFEATELDAHTCSCRFPGYSLTHTLTLLTYPLHLLCYRQFYSWPRTHTLLIRCQHQMTPRTSVRCVPHPKVKPWSWKTNATTVFRFLWLEPSHCRRHSSEHQSY